MPTGDRQIYEGIPAGGARRPARRWAVVWGMAVGALGLAGTWLPAATLTASLDRNAVPLGESVTLSLTFEGGAPGGSPQLPAFPGVQVRPGVSSRNEITVIQGQQSFRQIFDYVLVPTQVGDVVIPALQIQVGQEVLTSQPLLLKVVPAGAQTAVTNLAFLRLIVPRTQVYVGEPFPVEMQLYIRSARDVTRPQLEAEGFSFGAPTQGQQTRTQVGGVLFELVVFKLAATPVKAGRLNLGPATCDLTVLIPVNPPQRRDPFGGLFGDPFGGMFNRNVKPQRTTLASETIPIEVLPLPTENVPATFNGAVGTFQLHVSASPTEVAVGDPITLRAQLTGTGPIETLSLPAQPGWSEFKTYPPSSEVQLRDALGLSGHKTFTQVLIPQNHQIAAIPPLQFSFFDTQARQYRTLSGRAIPLKVSAGATPVAPPPMLATNAASGGAPPADDILPVNPHLGSSGPPPPFLALQPWFLSVQCLPVLAWLSVWCWRRRAELLANNPRLRRQRAVAVRIRAGLKELRAHAAAGQAAEFFATLFHLLQEQLGERLDLPASAITEAVIDEKLRGRDLSGETLATLHELFQSCNQARYARGQTPRELAGLIPRLEATLRALQQWKV